MDNEYYFNYWTAKLSRTDGGPFNVTDALKPQLGGVWAGKKKSELRFVVPRHGDVLKIESSNNPTKFLEGDRLILDTTPEQKIKKVTITNFPAPQAETASGQYTCRHYVGDVSSLSPDYKADASTVKWDKSVQTQQQQRRRHPRALGPAVQQGQHRGDGQCRKRGYCHLGEASA